MIMKTLPVWTKKKTNVQEQKQKENQLRTFCGHQATEGSV